jgi:hypothetical protein
VIICAGECQGQLPDKRNESKQIEMRDSVLIYESVERELFMVFLYPKGEEVVKK